MENVGSLLIEVKTSESPMPLTAFALCFVYGACTEIFESMPLHFGIVISIAAALIIIEGDQSEERKYSFFEYTVVFMILTFPMGVLFLIGFLLGVLLR